MVAVVGGAVGGGLVTTATVVVGCVVAVPAIGVVGAGAVEARRRTGPVVVGARAGRQQDQREAQPDEPPAHSQRCGRGTRSSSYTGAMASIRNRNVSDWRRPWAYSVSRMPR